MIEIYAVFEKDGTPRGFWPTDIFVPEDDGKRNHNIPEAAVKIDNETYQLLLKDQPRARFMNGRVEVAPMKIFAAPPNPFDEIKAALASISNRLDVLEGK